MVEKMVNSTIEYIYKKHILLYIKENYYIIEAYVNDNLIHHYEGEDKLKLFWEFETDNPSFRNVKTYEINLTS